MAIQFPEWWSFLSTFRIFLCSMLMHVPIHVAFPPVRKEQVFGGSFLHLLLISIVFSSFTIEFGGLPLDFIDCKNKKDLRFYKSWVKIDNIPKSSLEDHWWGASYMKFFGHFLCCSGKKPRTWGWECFFILLSWFRNPQSRSPQLHMSGRWETLN